ncbi:MAG: RNA polymerase sigma factor [Ktedonobacterales bacterium]
MDSDDAVCISRIAHGDHHALGKLYAQYRPSLYRYLWHYLHGDDCLVEEVLQDTFLAIWRAAAAFRGEARVATWVFRIARYSASHARRRPQKAMLQTVSLSDVEENEDFLVPVGHEERTLTRLALHDALARLTDKQRAAVLLVFVHGFTSEEAAEILGVPLGTVKSRLHAARALLANDPALQHSQEVNS